jgi:hypothetical protein
MAGYLADSPRLPYLKPRGTLVLGILTPENGQNMAETCSTHIIELNVIKVLCLTKIYNLPVN